mgnify:CR=1 FL=1
MDQLTQDCIAARKAGMSYGKWKALQPRVEVVMPKQEEPEAKKELPKRVCLYCGKEFATGHGTKRYCGYDCYYEAGKIRQRESHWRKKERMMANGNV